MSNKWLVERIAQSLLVVALLVFGFVCIDATFLNTLNVFMIIALGYGSAFVAVISLTIYISNID